MKLSDIKTRCREDGDCWIWRGADNGRCHPKVNVTLESGKRTQLSARRVAYEVANRVKLDARDVITVSCGCGLCMNPQHLVRTNRSEISAVTGQRPDVKLRRSKAQAMRQRKGPLAKLDEQKAREIRLSDETPAQLAQRFDVSESLIYLVRWGKAWKEYGANPFQGLMP